MQIVLRLQRFQLNRILSLALEQTSKLEAVATTEIETGYNDCPTIRGSSFFVTISKKSFCILEVKTAFL